MARATTDEQESPRDLNTTVKKSDGTDGRAIVLSAKVFGTKVVTGLMHQAVLAEAVNSRQDTRNTKTRGQVAGGGRKPYRQKGTGRARQGSISAPHYRHGGIVFGPHPRDLSAKLPKKARRVAITSALTSKMADGEVTVLESLSFDKISTKSAANLLDGLGILGKALVVLPRHDVTIYKSFRNIPGVEVRVAPAFSVRDVLDAGQVLIVQDALEALDAAWARPGAAAREKVGLEVAAA
jgi:large subunit ribosomal protein L4